MKTKIASTLIGVLTLTLATNNPVSAQNSSTQFVCELKNGVFATVGQTNYGNVPIIQWKSNYFSESGYDPQTRCNIVSERFQEYYSQGSLTYLSTGTQNNLPIICVAKNHGGQCEELLFTLQPGSNANQTLLDLMAVRTRSSGPLNQTQGRVYINLDEYLQEASQTISPNHNTNSVPSQLPPVW